MRRAAVLCALVAAYGSACGASSAPPAVTNQTARSVPRGPAPSVTFAMSAFTTQRIPAVAATGELVVAAISDSDGGRGYPNLRIEVRDRDDAIVRVMPVLIANDYERLVPDGQEPSAELRTTIAHVNEQLDALHAAHDLVPMEPIELTDKLRALAARFPAPSGKRCAQCEPCENPATVAAAYQAPTVDVIVVKITYAGTDLCWEPGDQWHVIR